MWWLWIAGPVLAALVFVLTDWRDKRRDDALERWRASFGPHKDPAVVQEAAGYREAAKKKVVDAPPGPGAKRVTAIPGALARLLVTAGGGQRVASFELVPKLAYLAVMHADLIAGSDHQTIVAKLDEAAPTFTVRPIALLDGQREVNSGVQLKKDAEFMDTFFVERVLEGDEASAPPTEEADKAIRKWLSPVVREALMDVPDAWLRVDGKSMAITLYGTFDPDRVNDLVTAADVIFAEYGAAGGPSLFGDEGEEGEEAEGEPEPTPPPKKATKSKKSGAGKAA